MRGLTGSSERSKNSLSAWCLLNTGAWVSNSECTLRRPGVPLECTHAHSDINTPSSGFRVWGFSPCHVSTTNCAVELYDEGDHIGGGSAATTANLIFHIEFIDFFLSCYTQYMRSGWDHRALFEEPRQRPDVAY